MKYGMPTLIECRELDECARVCAACGLDFIEINLSFPQHHSNHCNVDLMRSIADRYGIFYTFHADEQMNLFDFDDRVSECYLNILREDIRLALAVGAPLINLHLLLGVYVTLPSGRVYLNDVYRDAYLQKVRRMIALCEREIGDRDLRILIENVDTCPFTDWQAAALDLMMQSPVFGLTFDVGHEHCLGGKNRPIYLRYADRCLHMHLHDSDGVHPHMTLGEGAIDVPGVLSRTTASTCLIEVKTVDGLRASVAYLKSKLCIGQTDDGCKAPTGDACASPSSGS